MKFKSIDSDKELSLATKFLQKSFKWSSNKTKHIYNTLILNNGKSVKYGYLMKNENNKIVGCFLVFYQGKYELNKKTIKLINMSSLYVNKKERGISSLILIKKFLNDYSDCLITNVTANERAYRIMKTFKFKDSEIINKKYNAVKILLKRDLLKIKKLKEIFKNKIQNNSFNTDNYSKGNSLSTIFSIGTSELRVIYSPTYWEKKFGLINIKLRGIRILWTSDEKFFKQYFYQILLFFLIHKKGFFITTHFESDLCNDQLTNRQLFLLKDAEFNKRISLSLGSELVFL